MNLGLSWAMLQRWGILLRVQPSGNWPELLTKCKVMANGVLSAVALESLEATTAAGAIRTRMCSLVPINFRQKELLGSHSSCELGGALQTCTVGFIFGAGGGDGVSDQNEQSGERKASSPPS